MVDIIAPTPTEMERLAIQARLAQARETSEWLDIFQETVERGIATMGTTEARIEWRQSWKHVYRELKALELDILEEVEIENSPVANPDDPLAHYENGKPTIFYFPGRGGNTEKISFREIKARQATSFFVWLMSFQDTLQVAKKNRLSAAEGRGQIRAGKINNPSNS